MIKNEIQCDELEEVKTDLDQLRTSFEHEKVNQDKKRPVDGHPSHKKYFCRKRKYSLVRLKIEIRLFHFILCKLWFYLIF